MINSPPATPSKLLTVPTSMPATTATGVRHGLSDTSSVDAVPEIIVSAVTSAAVPSNSTR